jgi:hypothetical protein
MTLWSWNFVQGPALAVASSQESRRKIGFWLFLLSIFLGRLGFPFASRCVGRFAGLPQLMNIRGAQANTDDKGELS